jgi:uncharacterized BrkB/YihY/UPF0761 family membrane protein
LYGSIGIVFDIVTWFIAAGAVITLGAATGAVWERRRRPAPAAGAAGESVVRASLGSHDERRLQPVTERSEMIPVRC